MGLFHQGLAGIFSCQLSGEHRCREIKKSHDGFMGLVVHIQYMPTFGGLKIYGFHVGTYTGPVPWI